MSVDGEPEPDRAAPDTTGAISQPRPPRRLRRAWWAMLALAVTLGVALRGPAGAHLRAASLLVRFADPAATGALAGYNSAAVEEALATVATPHGEERARVYTPAGAIDAPGVVLVHGVHRLGIDEPRLVRFARAIASAGLVVLTPEIAEIVDYRVDPRSIETIGGATQALRTRIGRRAGVMGMCFAGSLSLLAASDPRFADDVGFVLSVGAHHDLARVARFFATDEIERPDGSKERLTAHEYGLLLLVYAHPERFFPAADAARAREALRLWLWEQPAEARAAAKELAAPARAQVEALFDHNDEAISAELLRGIDASRDAMGRVSPRGHLAGLKAPVFLLHGASDTVIPPTELLWLAGEVPPDKLRAALISPAILHVEIHGEPDSGEQWDLVHFMAGVLAEAAATER